MKTAKVSIGAVMARRPHTEEDAWIKPPIGSSALPRSRNAS